MPFTAASFTPQNLATATFAELLALLNANTNKEKAIALNNLSNNLKKNLNGDNNPIRHANAGKLLRDDNVQRALGFAIAMKAVAEHSIDRYAAAANPGRFVALLGAADRGAFKVALQANDDVAILLGLTADQAANLTNEVADAFWNNASLRTALGNAYAAKALALPAAANGGNLNPINFATVLAATDGAGFKNALAIDAHVAELLGLRS
jgi:hypothetical protein